MERGWWTLSIEMNGPNEADGAALEHIAELIKQGYTSGEVLMDEDEDGKD